MSQTKTYQYCNYTSLEPIVVTMSSGATTVYDSQVFECHFTNTTFPLIFSIPAAVPTDIIVYYSFHSIATDSFGNIVSNVDSNLHYTIPAGNTQAQVICLYTAVTDCSGTVSDQTVVYSNYQLKDQEVIPEECSSQPTGCTVTTVSAVVTAPTNRGSADGQIVFTIAGTTGATNNVTYKQNGVTKTTSGNLTHYTYTGLISGYYTLAAYQGFCYTQVTVFVPEGQFSTGTFNVSLPSSVTAANNPIVLNLGTTLNSNTPLFSKCYLRLSGTILEDYSLTFILNYPQRYTCTFYAKDFPDSSNYFLASVLRDESGIQVGTNTNTEIATSIAEALNSDIVLQRLYRIYSDGVYVRIEAKVATPALDLTSVRLISSAPTHIVLVNQVAGVAKYDGQLAENYSLYAELFINPDLQYGQTGNVSDFKKIGELEVPFQMDNVHIFQLNNILKNYVSTPKLDFSLNHYTTLSQMDLSYYVRYGEKFPLVPNSSTKKKRYKSSTPILYTVNSALDFETGNTMSNYLGTRISGLNNNFTVTGSNTTHTLTVNNAVASGYGTTNVKYAIYSGNNTTIYKNWQTSNSFTAVADNTYYAKVSGTTGGRNYIVSRRFFMNTYMVGTVGVDAYETLIPNPIANINWLTNSPSLLYVQRNSKQYLSFILQSNYGKPLSVRGDLYFYNGTSITGVTFFSISNGSSNYGGVFLLSCGYDTLNLAGYENSGNTKIRKVDFAVYQTDSNGTYPLTAIKSYIYEIDEAPTRYGVAFLNKLGLWDIHDFVGEIVYEEDVSRDTISKPHDVYSSGAAPLGFEYNSVYNTQYTNKITVNTGTIDLTTYVWLQELLQSNKIYNYNNSHQNFLVVDSQIAQKSTNTDEYTMSITFKETIWENNITV